MASVCESPCASPVRGRRRHGRIIESDSDEGDDEKDAVNPPCDILRQLAIATTRVVKPATIRVHSPADTHKFVSASLAGIPVPGSMDMVVASFHGNTLRMRPLSPAVPDTILASLEVGDCWNNDERESLVRILRVLAIEYKRTRIVLDISFLPPAPGVRSVRSRIDVAEALRTAFGPAAVDDSVSNSVAVDVSRALPGEPAKQKALVDAKLVRVSSGMSAHDARSLDRSMLASLKIFKVYSDKMARFLVDPDPGADPLKIVTEEFDARNKFDTIEADGDFKPCSFFLVGINTADGSVACVGATLDINGQPLIVQDVDPVRDGSRTVVAHRSVVVGTHGALYGFEPIWPVASNLIVRNLRTSIEIGAFYGNPSLKTDSARRLVAVLISLAADAVAERHERARGAKKRATLRRENMMAFVYANGNGVSTVVADDLDPSVPADRRGYSISKSPSQKGDIDHGQLGLRRLYMSLGLEPILVADEKNLGDRDVPLAVQDVYSTRYLVIDEQFANKKLARDATSLHVGSVDHVLQALSVRYDLEPVDIRAFKPLVTTLTELAAKGVYSIGRAVYHNPFMVIQARGKNSVAYAYGKKGTHGYSIIPEAKYDSIGVHRHTTSQTRFINIESLHPDKILASSAPPIIMPLVP